MRLSPPLFQAGAITLHSGEPSDFKIECDALTDEDWGNLAQLIARRVKFGAVVGVPRGGLALASKLQPHVTSGPTLIVDDVLTTGASIEAYHRTDTDIGIVVFARDECPSWVTPLFRASPFLVGVS